MVDVVATGVPLLDVIKVEAGSVMRTLANVVMLICVDAVNRVAYPCFNKRWMVPTSASTSSRLS